MLLYHDILKQGAIRIGEGGTIDGSTPADIESAYETFSSSSIDSAAFPFAVQRDALLMAEEKMAQIISSVKEHPLRIYLRGITDSLACYDVFPVEDEEGDLIIGVHGAIYDEEDNSILTIPESDNPAATIERLNRLRESGGLKADYRQYAFSGGIIVHSRPGSVIAEVCKYSRDIQQQAITGNEQTLFPDALEEMYVCGQIAYCFRDDESPATVKQFVEYWGKGLEILSGGGVPNR